jgi:hypothetical protein
MQRNLLNNAPIILGLMAAALPAFSRTPVSQVHITVRLFDYVNLPGDARRELEDNANRILGQAGVATEFLDCLIGGVETGAPACTTALKSTDLILRVFPPKLAVKGEQLGYAVMTPEGGAYITVFSNPEQRKARVGSLSDGVFLGHAVAHEVGHLLLGANSHTSSGIMRPVWRPIDEEWMAKGVLVFGNRQSSTMRSALVARSSR